MFLRLFLRKGPWFRLNTLSYYELTHIPTAASQLCQAGFASPIHPFDAAAASPALAHLTPGDINDHGAGDLEVGASDSPRAGKWEGCNLADAGNCSGQSVCDVAEALAVAELQQLMVQLELGPQGRMTGINKGQMLQRLKGGLEKANTSGAEVICLLCSMLRCAQLGALLDYMPSVNPCHP